MFASHMMMALTVASMCAQQPEPCTGCAIGVVVDNRTGAALSGATVRAGDQAVQTDEYGLYLIRIPASSLGGNFTLVIEKRGFGRERTLDQHDNGRGPVRVPTVRMRAPDDYSMVPSNPLEPTGGCCYCCCEGAAWPSAPAPPSANSCDPCSNWGMGPQSGQAPPDSTWVKIPQRQPVSVVSAFRDGSMTPERVRIPFADDLPDLPVRPMPVVSADHR
jgi:hypothetical protein